MFLPAKNEMTTHAQIESRREYFLQFNYVYTPDRYIGLWWQFRTRLMTDEDAKAFITQVAPLETMDYSLLQKMSRDKARHGIKITHGCLF